MQVKVIITLVPRLTAVLIPGEFAHPVLDDMGRSRITIATQNSKARSWYDVYVLRGELPFGLVIVLRECTSEQVYERKSEAKKTVEAIYNLRSCTIVNFYTVIAILANLLVSLGDG